MFQWYVVVLISKTAVAVLTVFCFNDNYVGLFFKNVIYILEFLEKKNSKKDDFSK